MHNDQSNLNTASPKRKFDLADRTLSFGIDIVNFVKELPQDTVNRPIAYQLIRSGTSIGANYSEADEANSKKDFINKIAIAKKETKETTYWLKLISATLESYKNKSQVLLREAQELNLIFAAIIRNSKIDH
jgi:four helix bundle protein